MSLQHDIAKRARRRAAAERSRDRREAAHLTVDQARVCWWFASLHRARTRVAQADGGVWVADWRAP